jgi:hypothetical protein
MTDLIEQAKAMAERLHEEQDLGWSGDAVCVDGELATEAAALICQLIAHIEALTQGD